MSATKIGKTQPIFYTAIFQDKFTIWHIGLKIYTRKTKFPFQKQNVFCILFTRNTKKTRTDHSILTFFSLSELRNVYLKCNSYKKVSLKCEYLWYNSLRWMFFVPCDNWKALFFTQIYRYPFFETSVLKKARILYPLSPQ